MNVDFISGELDGISTMFVVPTVPEDAPPVVREGLARRRITTIKGVCPCGGSRPKLPRSVRRRLARAGQPAELHSVAVEHEHDCPAVAQETEAHMRGWRWGG